MEHEQHAIEPERVAAVVAAIRAVDAPAPDRLRREVERAVAQAPRRRFALGRPLALAAGVATVLAVVLALVLVPGGGEQTPTAREVAQVALRQPTEAAPAARPGGVLDAQVDGIPFPRWSRWRAVGARSDRVGDRDVRTVFYADARGRRVGYTIASGSALPYGGGRYVRYGGVEMWVYALDYGGTAVMWIRDGRTCIVAGRGIEPGELFEFASARES